MDLQWMRHKCCSTSTSLQHFRILDLQVYMYKYTIHTQSTLYIHSTAHSYRNITIVCRLIVFLLLSCCHKHKKKIRMPSYISLPHAVVAHFYLWTLSVVYFIFSKYLILHIAVFLLHTHSTRVRAYSSDK